MGDLETRQSYLSLPAWLCNGYASAGSWHSKSLSPEGVSVNLNSLSGLKILIPFKGGVGEGELKFLKLFSGCIKVRSPRKLNYVEISTFTWAA